MYCENCGREIDDKAVICPGCGVATAKTVTPASDKISIGFNILSFFFPIVGFILYFSWSKTLPQKAKGCGISAVVGFVVNLLLMFAI